MTAPERITYLARRNPRFATKEEWIPRWRAHWALAASLPESATVRRYAQCEVLAELPAVAAGSAGSAGSAGPAEPHGPPHDAVAYAEYVSPEARVRNRSAEGYHAIMRADELEVFDRPIVECSFIGTHHVLAGAAEGPIKVVRFLRGDAGRANAGASAWERRGEQVLGAAHSALGYAQTRALDPAPAPSWGLDVAGAEELWFGDLGAATAYLHTSGDGDGSFSVVVAVVTDEVVLKDGRVLSGARQARCRSSGPS